MVRNVDAPLVAVGVVGGFRDGIVRDDVQHQVLGAVVADDVRFAGLEDERVARRNRRRALIVPDVPAPGDDVIEFPLVRVRVVWIGTFARLDSSDFDVKGMTQQQIGGFRYSAQRFGDLFARGREGASYSLCA